MIPRDHEGVYNETDQVEMMQHLARKRTLIPVIPGEDWWYNLSDEEYSQYASVMDEHSVCDVIFEIQGEDKSGQPMEVVEHLLHFINMVGLHYLKYDSWGITRSSILFQQLDDAIEKGFFDVTDYEDEIEDKDELVRVELQEYSYWVIATWMDLVEEYGPSDVQNEWELYQPALLADKQPVMFELCEQLDSILAIPKNLEEYKSSEHMVDDNIADPTESIQGTIKGRLCLDVKVVADWCIPGKPHFDPEGSVCSNYDEPNEAYCSYKIDTNACAYCDYWADNQTQSPTVVDDSITDPAESILSRIMNLIESVLSP